MNLSTLISPDAVICDIEVRSKKRALEVLADLLSLHTEPGDDPQAGENNALHIFQLLIEREKLGSTGMGHGVALPHARTDATRRAVGAFIKLKTGIDFDSPDQQPTDLIFALMVPAHCTEQHLQILAHLASLFSDETLCQSLRNATSADELYQQLTHWQIASRAS
ncbi:MAG TPA: PTS sugar transporter subunit IIA [Thiotrichales bacterium]|nr:PTS sugar transporter subunit IIA [Thiotrichales bacterium]